MQENYYETISAANIEENNSVQDRLLQILKKDNKTSAKGAVGKSEML